MGAVPVIETERLRLRPIWEGDLLAWSAVTADPDVARHIGGAPLSREETWRRLLATTGAWAVSGFGYWAAEMRGGDGRMVGHVGFADFKRDIDPPIDGRPEMGWVFAPEAHGKGLASEAVAAGLRWADETLRAPEITAVIEPANAPSIRVAEKAGFAQRETGTYRGAPILVFRRFTSF
ncbi:MAG: GNAT family N-acetyltransferase [Allosphingosinicella sp.]|uniref:GNAT family N-acetyltransferase n=1 Tax=Allosphingosinicella sp. TaxID=2823234 RepID=UPI00392D33F7